jgi:hypothetical protein
MSSSRVSSEDSGAYAVPLRELRAARRLDQRIQLQSLRRDERLCAVRSGLAVAPERTRSARRSLLATRHGADATGALRVRTGEQSRDRRTRLCAASSKRRRRRRRRAIARDLRASSPRCVCFSDSSARSAFCTRNGLLGCVSLAPACPEHVPDGSAFERVSATLEPVFGRLRVYLAHDGQAIVKLVFEPYESARLGVKFRVWLLALGAQPSADYDYSGYRLSRLDLSRLSRLITQLFSRTCAFLFRSHRRPNQLAKLSHCIVTLTKRAFPNSFSSFKLASFLGDCIDHR